MIIYKIESLIDGRMYIGQSTNTLSKRLYFYRHDVNTYLKGKYKARSKIISALAKYGFDNFRFFVIDMAISQEDLDNKEKFWISIYNSHVQGIGFNIQLGGSGIGKHSYETRKIMSDLKKGKPAHNKGKKGLAGENVGNAVLTQDQADQIRIEYKKVKNFNKLAKIYKCSRVTISNVVYNKTYKK